MGSPRTQGRTPSRVEVEELNWFNPNLDFRWFILPNLIGTINFLMGMIITGLTVARERELGTFDQMLVRRFSLLYPPLLSQTSAECL